LVEFEGVNAMKALQIISIIVFPISLGSFQLAIEQSRTYIGERIGMFRDETFVSIVFFVSLIFMVPSGIVVFFYSWILLIGLFVGTAITFPIFGRFLLNRLWYLPYSMLDNWARKKLGEDE
jgi:hypothetical protein